MMLPEESWSCLFSSKDNSTYCRYYSTNSCKGTNIIKEIPIGACPCRETG